MVVMNYELVMDKHAEHSDVARTEWTVPPG